MDSDSGDLLLRVVQQSGQMVRGASQTVLTPPGRQASPLVKNFTPGFIIEIDNFSLRLGTSGLEPGTNPQPQPTKNDSPTRRSARRSRLPPPRQPTKNASPTRQRGEDEKPASIGTLARKGGYQSWRAGSLNVQYPLDIQPITFEKPADMSSKTLIESCINCTSFDSATIIKRKPVGDGSAGDVYLRLDFTGVLVIKVDWADEDEYVKETISFIARGITMSYRPQMSLGTLGPVISGFWSMVPDEKEMIFS